MMDPKLALAGLDWLAGLGVSADLIDRARKELAAGDLEGAPGGPPPGSPTQRKPTRLAIEPATIRLSADDAVLIQVTREYSDKSVEYVTDDVVWEASNSIVSVDKYHQVKMRGISGPAQQVQLTAIDPTTQLRGTVTVWVNATAPMALAITPERLEIAPETTAPLKATRVYLDGRTEDVTSQVTWESSSSVVFIGQGGVATARGVTGDPQRAEITAVDADTGLRATAEAWVKPSDDVRLEVTPATVELAPGGSVRFKAMRGAQGGPMADVTTEILWGSSSPAIAIDNQGVATASASLTASATVDITADDFKGDLRTTVTAWVKVPSHEERRFATPFGEIVYFAGFADQVKQRLENARTSFLLAEKAEATLDQAYETMRREQDKHERAFQGAAADIRKNDRAVKPDAIGAKGEDLSKDEVLSLSTIVQGLIDGVRGDLASAQRKLDGKKQTKHWVELQKEVAAYNASLDIITTAVNDVIAVVSENPAALIGAAANTISLMLKQTNSVAEEAGKLRDKIVEDELKDAQADLDRVQASIEQWQAKHADVIRRYEKRLKNASDHWKAVEKKYDTEKGNTGAFRFKDLKVVMTAAEDTLLAAARLADVADLAQRTADDLMHDDPKPGKWLAHPDKHENVLRTMLTEATGKVAAAKERQAEAAGLLTKLDGMLAEARSTMSESTDTDEP